MAMISNAHLLSFSLSLILLCNASLAQIGAMTGQGSSPFDSQRRFGALRDRCRNESLSIQEVSRKVKSQAGVTEYFDEDNEQFRCAGVTAHLRVIEPNGLLLPLFYNAPGLVYVIRGEGIFGTVMPGCPESFQSFEQREPRKQEGRGQAAGDQHQRVNQFRDGDVFAMPAGVAHWVYNNGDKPVVTFAVLDTSNTANQLDENRREFLLAGRKQREQSRRGEDSGDSLVGGFSTESLADVLGISRELAEKIKGRDDDRGEIVKVEGEFQMVRPSRERQSPSANGLDQAFCSMSVKHNINDPRRADIYNPRAGMTTTLNSQKLPILAYLRLNAVRGVLNRNASVAPHWNINAHSIMFVTAGTARIQVVGSRGKTAFDREVRRGQLIVVPQNFALMIQAGKDGFEWVAIKTNDQALVSPIIGKTSVLKGLPEEVVRVAYRLTREQAKELKEGRGEELLLIAPGSAEPRGRDEA